MVHLVGIFAAEMRERGGGEARGVSGGEVHDPPYPFASSEVEMPIGLSAIPMGVSTSLDTNGIWGGR
ncbi:hypothetical protein [Sphingopyxis sp. PET50]|uniref:hypothetical protein n=1 Tax=Sphingopyxis sp. PET50 TaxID=2976533 RepID=UPI0021B024AA|nr:hypothetical protein [Sphingopyxis sp. PET50]